LSSPRQIFIFPAFADDHSGHRGRELPGLYEQLNLYLNTASKFIDPALGGFDFHQNNFLGDELKNQYISCIYSCASSQILRQMRLSPVYSAGYSMGIYAALFDSNAITLETALEFIRIAYHSLRGTISGTRYGMGTIIGLNREDIEQISRKSNLQVEIANQNASYSFVISGVQQDVSALLSLAKEEGALHTRNIPVSVPYHSNKLKPGAIAFADRTSHLTISLPTNPIVSLIDQKELSTPDDLRQELFRNLFHPLNWLKTTEWFIRQGIQEFIECGPSGDLAKNARFIEGDYRFLTLDKVQY